MHALLQCIMLFLYVHMTMYDLNNKAMSCCPTVGIDKRTEILFLFGGGGGGVCGHGGVARP